jgi:hypothetical protein
MAAVLIAGACPDLAGIDNPPLRYEVSALHCSDNCTIFTGFAPTATAGDTLSVLITIEDTLPGDSVLVRLRALCDVNIELRQDTQVPAVLPANPTCPDSTFRRYVGQFPRIEGRAFTWVVDAGIPLGDYVLISRIMVDPPAVTTVPIRIE